MNQPPLNRFPPEPYEGYPSLEDIEREEQATEHERDIQVQDFVYEDPGDYVPFD